MRLLMGLILCTYYVNVRLIISLYVTILKVGELKRKAVTELDNLIILSK